jgi:hypothetical protein
MKMLIQSGDNLNHGGSGGPWFITDWISEANKMNMGRECGPQMAQIWQNKAT